MIIDSLLTVSLVTPDVIKHVVDKIVTTVQPSKIILFGSQARGDASPDSDIDLLVITKSGENREQIRLEIERVLRGRLFNMDLIVRSPEDIEWNIESENPFYIDEILNNGRVLHER
jgi:predicted nucleotidyltransferase